MEPFVSLASFQNLWRNYFVAKVFSPVQKALPPVVVLGVGKQQARQPFKTSSGLAVPAGNDVLSRNSSSVIVISCVSYSRAIFIVITHWGEERQDGFHLKRGKWDCARPWEASRGKREVGRTESYEIYQPKKRKTTELLQKSQIFTVLQKFWFQIGETQVFVILSSFWDLNHQQFSEINGSFWGGTLHRACTLINCPKQHNNTLNVSKIANRRAKSQKYGH